MSVGDKMRLFKDLYQYRELLKTNVKKEIRGKYKGSFLGVLWSFINPLLQVLVYAIVFPFIMRSSPDHFIVYLVIGIIPWNFILRNNFYSYGLWSKFFRDHTASGNMQRTCERCYRRVCYWSLCCSKRYH